MGNENGMVYHTDKISLDKGFNLTGLLPMHKATFSIFKNRAYLLLRPLL